MTRVRVRRGDPGDRPRLRSIQTAALAEPAPELLDAAVDPGPPGLHVAVDGPPRGATAGGTRTAGEPVGYAVVVAGDRAYLPELAVAPGRQGEGIGSALLDAVCADLRERDVGRLRVTARADDRRARAFYGGNGFEAVERVPGFFDGCDGVVLALDL